MANHTILLIDYEPRTADTLGPVFERAGFRVEVAADGVKGVRSFDSIKPLITLIEVMLPRKSGLEVCRELKNTDHGQTAKIVMMSSRFRSRQYRSEALHKYKADDFLEKPIAEAQLQRLIDKYGAAVAPPAAPSKPAAAPAQVQAQPNAAASEPDLIELEITDHLDSILGADSPPRGPNGR